MGYYARGSGSLQIRDVDDDTLDGFVEKILTEFEDCSTWPRSKSDGGGISIDFWMDSKYHDDNVCELLRDLEEMQIVLSGEVDYQGEDDTFWRYLYDPEAGRFIYQEGCIVYG